jgi:hypothetical protein
MVAIASAMTTPNKIGIMGPEPLSGGGGAWKAGF